MVIKLGDSWSYLNLLFYQTVILFRFSVVFSPFVGFVVLLWTVLTLPGSCSKLDGTVCEGTSLDHLLLLGDLFWDRLKLLGLSLFMALGGGQEDIRFHVTTVAKGQDHLPVWVVELGLGWPGLLLLCSCWWASAQVVEWVWGLQIDLHWASPLLVLWWKRYRLLKPCLWKVLGFRHPPGGNGI